MPAPLTTPKPAAPRPAARHRPRYPPPTPPPSPQTRGPSPTRGPSRTGNRTPSGCQRLLPRPPPPDATHPSQHPTCPLPTPEKPPETPEKRPHQRNHHYNDSTRKPIRGGTRDPPQTSYPRCLRWFGRLGCCGCFVRGVGVVAAAGCRFGASGRFLLRRSGRAAKSGNSPPTPLRKG